MAVAKLICLLTLEIWYNEGMSKNKQGWVSVADEKLCEAAHP
jgi:hypothetical protein